MEPRLLLAFEPTAVEQLYLEQLNDARANPPAYGQSINFDLSGVAPSQPLAFDPRLVQAARLHSQDMHDRHFFDHVNPDGLGPGQRIQNAGFPQVAFAESISAGPPTTAGSLADLIIDAGVPGAGHRVQLLALNADMRALRLVGIGVVQDDAVINFLPQNFYTIDEANTSDPTAYLTGVVFQDANGDGKYGVGEGLGGVTVSVAGGPSVTTWGSGGYTIPLAPGTYTVTASGGLLAQPITRTVAVGATNARLNFIAGAPPPPPPWVPLPANVFVTAADAGGGPDVKVLKADGTFLNGFFAFDRRFTGGVRVATGDVNGDGFPDVICAAGPGGGPNVIVFGGKDGSQIYNFFAFDQRFTGGCFVAAGDVNGDGSADIIVGADAGGGPNVFVLSGKDRTPLLSYFPYDIHFTGGVRVAAGDVNNDGRADLITGAGPGGGPNVTVYQFRNGQAQVLQSYFAFDSRLGAGLFVGAGDVNGDRKADVIAGTGALGAADAAVLAAPAVAVFSGADASPLNRFTPFPPPFTGAVRVGAADRGGTGKASVLAVRGPGGTPDVNTFDGLTGLLLDRFFAYDPNFTGGTYLANTPR